MDFKLNGYAVTLILLGLLTLFISGILFKRLGRAIHSFGYVMAGIAIWAISYGLELASGNLTAMLFWINIEYIGISFLPALWIVFILKFIGKDKLLSAPWLTAIFFIPVLTLSLVATNHFHHLYYLKVEVDNSGPFPLLSLEPGIWYRVHTVYFYIMLFLGLYLLLVTFKNADAVYKKQNNIIIFSALIPWFVNLLYLLGYKPYNHIDLTPFAFILTSLGIGFGLLRFSLFDIVPIARSKIIDAMKEGVLVINSNYRVVDVNANMKNMLRAYTSAFIGADIGALGILPDNFKDILLEKIENKIELKLNVNGVEKYYAVTITSLYEKDTVYSGYILLFRDVTDRKQAEEKLQTLNKLKDRLFSIIAHDLRSPLNTLMGIITMTNDGHITEAELKSFIPEIAKSLGYTTGLVDNLLIWSKSQLTGEKIHPTDFDIYDTAEYVIELFRKTASEKRLNIVNGLNPQTIIHADENMIQAVFRNLVSNAIKFSRVDGEICITTKTEPGYITICIRDNGVGIKEEDMAKLFAMETFTTRGTGDEKGTGLGLLLCKDFVEKNKGTIWAESDLGKGSKFCFRLPGKS